jgi:DNA-binding GntR family transcriptional regulator
MSMSEVRTTVADAIASEIRKEIRSGGIEAGARLRQVEVAARFNVSTTPVREAFAALQREGLLVGSAHRGVTVFRPTIENLRETYEIRIPLEALATAKGVENMNRAAIQDLAVIVDEMKHSADDAEHYGQLNARFHGLIYLAANRPKLTRLIQDLRDDSTSYLNFYVGSSPIARDTQRDHELILEACKSRAPRRAAKAMTVHLQHTVDFVSQALQDRQADPSLD